MDNDILVLSAIVALNNNRVVTHMTDAMLAAESGMSISSIPYSIKSLMAKGSIKRYRINVSKKRRQYYYVPCNNSEETLSPE